MKRKRRIAIFLGACATGLVALGGLRLAEKSGKSTQTQAVPQMARERGRSVESWDMQGVYLYVSDADPGLEWAPIVEFESLPEHLVLLVHGLDEPGGIWDDLAPAVASEGFSVARFEYPNDQAIADSADLLAQDLRHLHDRGVRSVDLVCHSMGGLVSRDVLTRKEYYDGTTLDVNAYPDVQRFIMLGTPNLGSPWAKYRIVAEVREQVARFWESEDFDLSRLSMFQQDGTGEAGRDLMPGSEFLDDLNARELPEPVVMTCVVGIMVVSERAELGWLNDLIKSSGIAGEGAQDDVSDTVFDASESLGDGVVPASSAELPGVEDVVRVQGNHRTMVRTLEIQRHFQRAIGEEEPPPPASLAIVLDRLQRPLPWEDAEESSDAPEEPESDQNPD